MSVTLLGHQVIIILIIKTEQSEYALCTDDSFQSFIMIKCSKQKSLIRRGNIELHTCSLTHMT